MGVQRRSSHVLAVIVGLLVVSGGTRLALGVSPAIAFAEDRPARAEVVPDAAPADEIGPLLAALQDRELRVTRRETAIEDRMRALSVAESELTERLAEVEAAETSLSAALVLSETANETDIGRLTTVYENMKPADAAAMFEQMSPDFASGFLIRMNPVAAAAVLAGLEPQTAYSISVIIAGRNANAPTQ